MGAGAIYQGRVRHRRNREVEHSFAYPIWMLWLDLVEAERGLEVPPLFSTRRAAPLGWRRRDHFGDPSRPLAECARDLVEERHGLRPEGPVRLLTMARTLGASYNPVSFFYMHDRGGGLRAAIAEVTSTPWGERRHYVLAREAGDGPLRGEIAKDMHVSPFMPMRQAYDWTIGEPGESLGLRIASREGGREVFSASLALRRRPLDRRTLARLLLTRPPQPQVGLARIYLQALRLKARGASYHPPPPPPAAGRQTQPPAAVPSPTRVS
jgi:DUF1365 family protein